MVSFKLDIEMSSLLKICLLCRGGDCFFNHFQDPEHQERGVRHGQGHILAHSSGVLPHLA